MKSIYHKIGGGLYFYSLLYLALTLPFQRFFNPIIGLVGLFLGALYYLPKSGELAKRLNRSPVLWFSAWWLLYAFGILYSDYPTESIAEAIRVLPILIIPLAWFVGPELKRESVLLIFRGFVGSIVISLLASEIYGLYNYWENKNIGNLIPPQNYLYYAKLAQFTGLHTSYYALYVATAFFILLWDIYYNKQRKLLHYTGLAFLFLMMFIISARTQIAAFIALLTAVVGITLLRRMGWQKALLSTGLLFLIFTITLLAPRRTRERVFELGSYWSSLAESDRDDYRNPRFYLWDQAWETFAASPLIGHGTADGLEEFRHRIENQTVQVAKEYSIAELEAADLMYKDELIRRYKSAEMDDTVSDSFFDGRWEFTGDISPVNETGIHIEDIDDHVLVSLGGLDTGRYYFYRFEIKNRIIGGIYVAHNDEVLEHVRERAADNKVEIFGFFKAESDRLVLGAVDEIDTKIDVVNPFVGRLKYIPKSFDEPAPSMVDNPIEVSVRRFQFHSQFLDYMTRFGILGLAMLIMTFAFTIRAALRHKNGLFVAFAILLFISLLPEHMMSRQAGLFFIAFFGPAIFIYGKSAFDTRGR